LHSGMPGPIIDRVRSSILVGLAIAIATAATPSTADVIQNAKPPAEILARAQAHLVSQVGAEYAARNYELRLDQTTSISSTGDSPPRSYTVGYQYRTWSDIGAAGSTIYVEVPVNPDQPASGFVATFDHAGKVLEPKVTRAAAETKMREAVPGVTLRRPAILVVPGPERTTHPQWWGTFPVGPDSDSCWVTRRVNVDSVTGDVSIEADSTSCE
jgi:hypothetical protein